MWEQYYCRNVTFHMFCVSTVSWRESYATYQCKCHYSIIKTVNLSCCFDLDLHSYITVLFVDVLSTVQEWESSILCNICTCIYNWFVLSFNSTWAMTPAVCHNYTWRWKLLPLSHSKRLLSSNLCCSHLRAITHLPSPVPWNTHL